jgi:hypothetical protein
MGSGNTEANTVQFAKKYRSKATQVASTLVTPGLSTVIDPIQIHIVLLVSSIAGNPPNLSFLETGDQGIIVIGLQGAGLKTGTGPTICQHIGLITDLHCPKAGTFNMGTKSISAAKGLLAFMAMDMGKTTISLGPAPKEHFNFAPI